MNATVIIQMTAQDAEALANASMTFGPDWAAQDGRFETVTEPTDGDPNLYRGWTAYWVDSAASMILLRSYVAAFGHDYAVLYDSNDKWPGYVVLTTWANR
jgi:hypothetical protein